MDSKKKLDLKRLKIAFLCRDVGKVHRGVETYVVELSKRLAQKYTVEILDGKDAYSFSKITHGKFDVIIPTNGRTQALKASLGRLTTGYKTIISGQSGIGRDDIWNITVTCPNVYVALTDLEFEWAQKWAFRTKVVKIPNGVDLKKFSPQGTRAEINLPHPIILSVGALEWYKHHDRTIRALAKLKQGSLIIVGLGKEKEKLMELGRTELGNKRFQIVKATFEEIPKYYRAADLFVLPSWEHEAFGIVYLEAMASGCPVVAPNDPLRQEIVGPAGILVDTQDPEKYAAAISQALETDWQDLPIKQASTFSWDKIAAQYDDLIGEIVK